MSLFRLLPEKKFGPFFGTQFLGAYNDNIFKNALVILIAYQVAGQQSGILVNLAAGLFILPFFIFSSLAGQITDKFEKATVIRKIKFIEIIIMIFAAIGFYINNIWFLIFVLFCMGTQSAFFGPAKYSILPQHLDKDDLLAGNALVGMGTFLAILLGTMTGGVLIALENNGALAVSFCVILVAMLGYVFSRGIPNATPNQQGLTINFNPFTTTYKIMRELESNKVVFISILGISWFWFFGFFFLAQFPAYTRDVLHGDKSIVTLFLTMFSVGIGLGSFFCEKISGKRVDAGLVPIGSIGLSLFAFDLFLVKGGIFADSTAFGILTVTELVSHFDGVRILFDLVMIGFCGGFYIVPLYTLIQDRGEHSFMSRIIAGNNVYNAFFMVMAAVFAMILIKFGITIPGMFCIISILNIFIFIYMLIAIPEFLQRFFGLFQRQPQQ
ncbi:MAG: MFS transporter [Bacteriovoracaceae bacterium]|nr:MFS transporter [Bacteriovoracaceae bacterium]